MPDSLIFSANAVLPIVLLIALGYFLKRIKLLTSEFLNIGNKLTFRVFLPVMLFYNVYGIKSLSDINAAFIAYGIAAVLLIFFASIAAVCAFVKDGARCGSLIQALFRSNYAIIGLPLAEALFGASGAAAAGVMSAFCVPTFNILAVITLTVFNGNSEKSRADVKKILLGVIKNPLIIGTLAGVAAIAVREIFVQTGITFRLSDITFLYKAIESVKSICTPFALIVLGGRFEFSAVSRLRREIIFGTAGRTVIVPIIGLSGALLLRHLGIAGLAGEHFAAYVGVFATPAAVSSAIMAKEMGADGVLSDQLVVWTSLISAVTIFIYVTVLRSIGVF